MKTLVSLLALLAVTHVSFPQGQFSQTTTADFKNNANFNINTTNDELKLTNDVGTGADGNLYVPPGGVAKTDSMKSAVTGNNPSGQNAIQVQSTAGFSVGDEILIITMRDRNTDLNNNLVGQYEFRRIARKTATAFLLNENLKNTYDSTGKSHQVIRVPNFNSVTVDVGGTLTCGNWDGLVGGVLVFRATGIISVTALGSIDATGKGYKGGGSVTTQGIGMQGECLFGTGIQSSSYYLNSGGGGGFLGSSILGNAAAGGGGGSYGTVGVNGANGTNGYQGYYAYGGTAGITFGTQFLTKLFLGGSGGGGSQNYSNSGYSGMGGNGGGIIFMSCDSVFLGGKLKCDGSIGDIAHNNGGAGAGGGGSGGSINMICTKAVDAGNAFISAVGGLGGQLGINGGIGGKGRIRIDARSVSGTSDPPLGYNGTSYALLGTSTTPSITKALTDYWNDLSFTGNTSAPGTSINVDVLSGSDSVLLSNVGSGTNLHQAGILQSITTIKLRVRLINTFGNQTPMLYDWSLKWGPTLTEAATISSELPEQYALYQNYPNPFNPTSIIRYDLPKPSFVTLKVYDVLGREVSTLVDGRQEPGVHQVNWQASGFASGVYFYRLQAGSFVETKKLILLH